MMPQANFPFRLDHPRAWRTYLGGARLDALHGAAPALCRDGHFPEEWLFSVVAARNAGREHIRGEGLSHLMEAPRLTLKEVLESQPAAYLGSAHAAVHGAQPGVLVKLIDSAERLTIQVHPDRQTARRLFGSPFGKTECWHILDGRPVDGQPPCIYLGFREGVTPDQWRQLFLRQDIPAMLGCLHRFEVQPGDTVLIEGGVPHAIGAGCFLAEIQEPTDYTIRVERKTPSGFAVADEMCHQGLGFERMFDCFRFEGASREATRQKWFLEHRLLYQDADGSVLQLAGYKDTPLFALHELCTSGTLTVNGGAFSGLYALRGKGVLACAGRELEISAPGQYFVPAGAGRFTLRANPGAPLRLLQCFGPQVQTDQEDTVWN